MLDIFVLSIGIIAVGFGTILLKKITSSRYKGTSYTLVWAVINSIGFVPIAILNLKYPHSMIFWVLAILTGMCYSLSNRLNFMALQNIDVSLNQIIRTFSVIMVFIAGTFLFKDKLTLINILGLAAAVIGIYTVTYQGKKVVFNKGILFALLSTLLVVCSVLIDKSIINNFNVFTYAFLQYFFQIPFVLCIPGTASEALKIVKRYNIKLIATAAFFIIAWSCYIWTLSRNSVSIVYCTYNIGGTLLTVILGITLLKERQSLVRKIAGLIFISLGIILINIK